MKEPIPRPRLGVRLRHPWYLLNLGVSIFIQTDKRAGVILTGAKNYFRRRNEKAKFTTRSETREGVRGVRIWRVYE